MSDAFLVSVTCSGSIFIQAISEHSAGEILSLSVRPDAVFIFPVSVIDVVFWFSPLLAEV